MPQRRTCNVVDIGVSIPNSPEDEINRVDEHGENSSSSGSSSPTEVLVKPDGWGARHTMTLLGFWGFVASYAMRASLSIAIVKMVSANATGSANKNHSTDVCPNLLPLQDLSDGQTLASGGHAYEGGEFDWNGEDQRIILGAFFWSYAVTQVPGGMLAAQIGGKWPFGIGVLVTAILSLLTPWAARTSISVLIVVRIIQGFGEGVTNPAMHAILAKWLPPLERSKLGTFVYAGGLMGTVIAMPLCAFLISSGFLGGWPAVFYVMGAAGIVWFVFWTIFIFDTPALHPRIEAKELSYIQHSIGGQVSEHKLPTPWRKMLTSMPFLAILVAQTGEAWGISALMAQLSTYLKNVLLIDIKDSGWLSALPYFLMWIVAVFASFLADFLRERDIASTTMVRKLFNSIGHWAPAIALVGAGYSGCDRLLTVTLVAIAIGINGCVYGGYQLNHLDIAPNHAAVMMGITHGFADLCGMAAPYVASVITNDSGTLSDWRLVFIISASIFVMDNIFYVMFASGEEQPWNRELESTYKSIDDE